MKSAPDSIGAMNAGYDQMFMSVSRHEKVQCAGFVSKASYFS
jgi:hypothetical protein